MIVNADFVLKAVINTQNIFPLTTSINSCHTGVTNGLMNFFFLIDSGK